MLSLPHPSVCEASHPTRWSELTAAESCASELPTNETCTQQYQTETHSTRQSLWTSSMEQNWTWYAIPKSTAHWLQCRINSWRLQCRKMYSLNATPFVSKQFLYSKWPGIKRHYTCMHHCCTLSSLYFTRVYFAKSRNSFRK